MKKLKSILLATFGFIAIGGLVFSTSCEKDPCSSSLTCLNGGNCSDGVCHCPAGYEGAQCETQMSSRFVGEYTGVTRCNYNNIIFPIVADSVKINLYEQPNKLSLVMYVGNTSVLDFKGIASTPDAIFETFNNGVVSIHPSIQVDGDLIYVYLETITLASGERQICKFTGQKVRPEIVP